MIRNNQLGQKSHDYSQIQSKPMAEVAENPTVNAENTLAKNEDPEFTQDQAELAPPPTQAQNEPIQVHFADKSSLQAHEMPAMEMTDWDPTPISSPSETDESYFDPGVIALLDMIQNAEDKMVKDMLDMMEKSLERARELSKASLDYFYEKIQPQMEQMEEAVNQAQQAQESGDKRQLRAALSQFVAISQEVQNQLTQAQGDPSAIQEIKKSLDLSQILNTLH